MLGKKLRFLEYLHEIRDREENLLTMHTVLLILSHGHHWHDK